MVYAERTRVRCCGGWYCSTEEWSREGKAAGGRNGFELYHCELIPLFTEEWKRQKEEKEQKVVYRVRWGGWQVGGTASRRIICPFILVHTGRQDRETGSQSDQFIVCREPTGGEGHSKTTTGNVCVCVRKQKWGAEGLGGRTEMRVSQFSSNMKARRKTGSCEARRYNSPNLKPGRKTGPEACRLGLGVGAWVSCGAVMWVLKCLIDWSTVQNLRLEVAFLIRFLSRVEAIRSRHSCLIVLLCTHTEERGGNDRKR